MVAESQETSAKAAIAFTYTQTAEGIKKERVLLTEKEGKISVEKIL